MIWDLLHQITYSGKILLDVMRVSSLAGLLSCSPLVSCSFREGKLRPEPVELQHLLRYQFIILALEYLTEKNSFFY